MEEKYLDLGVFADKIYNQVLNQNYYITEKEGERFEKLKNSIYMLSFYNFISEDKKVKLLDKLSVMINETIKEGLTNE